MAFIIFSSPVRWWILGMLNNYWAAKVKKVLGIEGGSGSSIHNLRGDIEKKFPTIVLLSFSLSRHLFQYQPHFSYYWKVAWSSREKNNFGGAGTVWDLLLTSSVILGKSVISSNLHNMGAVTLFPLQGDENRVHSPCLLSSFPLWIGLSNSISVYPVQYGVM